MVCVENTSEKKRKRGYFLRKEVLAFLILLMIFGYAGINIAANYEVYADTIRAEFRNVTNGDTTIAESISVLEDVLTEEAVERMKFIELYSYEHVLLGKEEIKNFSYLKDRKGYLHYASFYREHDETLFELALRVKRLQDSLADQGTKVIFVIPPAKGSNAEKDFSKGLPVNDPDRIVDEMMFWLNRLGVATLNYAEYLPNDDLPFEAVFFKTDHHWTIDAAFYATQLLLDKMNEVGGAGIGAGKGLSTDDYQRVVHKNAMLGSMGRGAGVNFSGVEDYAAYYPKTGGHYRKETIREDGRVETSEGEIYGTLIDTSVFDNDDLYRNQAYSFYMNAIKPYDHVENLDNPDGIKVLMVRDSYFAPVMTFMAPFTGRIDSIWSLEEIENLSVEGLLSEVTYDYVIIEVYPYNISEDAFQFFEEPRE